MRSIRLLAISLIALTGCQKDKLGEKTFHHVASVKISHHAGSQPVVVCDDPAGHSLQAARDIRWIYIDPKAPWDVTVLFTRPLDGKCKAKGLRE
jgi:hypothetical protein